MTDLLDIVFIQYKRKKSLRIHLLNVNGLTLSWHDSEFRKNLMSADVIVPDGKPITWFCQDVRHSHIPTRGSDILSGILKDPRFLGARHLFLGGRESEIEYLRAGIESKNDETIDYELLTLPFDTVEGLITSQKISQIDLKEFDFIWVGLGTPKQDFIAAHFSEKSDAILIPIGAVFDFLSGRVKEAPYFMRYRGFEWIFRLYGEPARLAVRYLKSNVFFLLFFVATFAHSRLLKLKQTAKGIIKKI